MPDETVTHNEEVASTAPQDHTKEATLKTTEVDEPQKHDQLDDAESVRDKQQDNELAMGQDKQSVQNSKRLSSGTESDSEDDTAAENETFEDAIDTTSVRSLTKRSVSGSKPQPSPMENREASEENNKQNNDSDDDSTQPSASLEKSRDDQALLSDSADDDSTTDEATRRKSSATSHRISNTSNLDNINLDDDSAASTKEESKSLEDKELPDPPSKTLSLSSITNSFPTMPWSPPAESPSKSPAPAPAGAAAAAAAAPPASSSLSNPPAPPSRKLTSPFSWLSRNSTSKDKDTSASPPTGTTPRRNTASSVATLTSNPEMMLSRLDEEKDGEPGSARNSLKDRFKMLRLQEESALTSPIAEENSAGAAALAGTSLVAQREEAAVGDKPPPSPVPSPNPNLAPGTVSGVNAGPSAMPDTQVDWDLWQSVVYEGPAAVARTSAEELNKAIATGIPSAIRGVIWQVLANSKSDDLELVYKELAARGTDKEKNRHSHSTTASSLSNGNLSAQSGDIVTSSASSVTSEPSTANGTTSPKTEKNAEALQKAQAAAAAERKKKDKEDAAMIQRLEKSIRRDLGARTSYSKYAAAAGLQEGLFGVCKAYALYDEDVGYAQGMNFLIMPLLFNMPEQEAFCLLVKLMNQYKLRDLFVQDMPGLHMHLYQFERLLEDFEPALYCHLHRRGISPHLYATQWFLTLFSYRFPLQLVLRIYDLILSEGLSAILRFGIVLMQKNASTLLGLSDMQQLTTYLKDKLFDVYIDKDPSQGSLLENGFFGSSSSSIDKEVYRADQLIRDACEIKITPETLKAYTVEWEEKTRTEKERETELHELRAANHHLAIKVRKLEERVEICDREQAGLATDLVHTKVDNEELQDENESLKGQVRELRIVIEKQPLEIEETWKLERDDLMKRNEKVHEENQKLEKELAELEEELVQTKMQYAEINSQHETLTRKWTDLKRQFA